MQKSTSRGISEVAGILKKIYSAMIVLLVAAGFVVVYFLKPLLLPIVFALLLSMLLRPLQNILVHRLKLPEIVAALFIVGFGFGVFGMGAYLLATPAQQWMERIPKDSKDLRDKLEALRSPIIDVTDQVRNAAAEMAILSEQIKDASAIDLEGVASPSGRMPDEGREPKEPVQVEIAESPLSKTMVDYARDFVATIISTTVLSILLLAYGQNMSQRIKLTSDRTDEMLLPAVAREVSRYLGTVTLINSGLGVVIAFTLWGFGMPNPMLWGLMATILNFIPYIGALIGAAVVAVVSFATFSTQESVLLIVGVPAAYIAITAFEGNIVTPAILGRNFSVNPIMIFVWFVLWSWLWGIPGGLVAVPVLMGVYIIMRGVPEFHKLADAISIKSEDEAAIEEGLPDIADPKVL